mgnify:CR=1 FL=1
MEVYVFEREIVDYKLVTGEHDWMAEKVPQFIREGWQPFGGLSHVTSHYGAEKFAQAMVKYAKDDDVGEGES